MHSRSDNIEIMINDAADEVIKKNFLIHFKIDINRLKVVIVSSIMFIYCIINDIK